MGATGVNPQLSSKQSMVNSLPTFPADIKNTSVTSVPNMVSCPWLSVVWVLVGALAYRFYCTHRESLTKNVVWGDRNITHISYE